MRSDSFGRALSNEQTKEEHTIQIDFVVYFRVIAVVGVAHCYFEFVDNLYIYATKFHRHL